MGILALGIIAKGAKEAIYNHFENIFPFLMSSIDNQEPFVQSIACWTLSRYN